MTQIDVNKIKQINSLGFDAQKTEELISGLKDKGVVVGIEDLSRYLRQRGIIAKVHIGGMGSEIEVPIGMYGVDLDSKDEEVKSFVKKHMKKNKMCFLPIEDQNQLNSIEQSVRKKLKECAIGYEESFVPLSIYNEYYKYFRNKKAKYLMKVREICSKWELLMETFKRELAISMEQLNSVNKDEIYAKIISSVPTKKAYRKSFYMTINCKAFPVTENLDMYEDNIKQQIQDGLNEDTVRTLYDIIGNTLNDAFANVNRMLFSVQKATSKGIDDINIPHKTINAVRECAERIGQKNIFYNEKIDEIRRAIKNMLKYINDIDTLVQKAEIIQTKIYFYAQDLNILNKINMSESVLSVDELTSTMEMLEDETIVFDIEDESTESETEPEVEQIGISELDVSFKKIS